MILFKKNVKVSTANFSFSWGHSPRGVGEWSFDFGTSPNEPMGVSTYIETAERGTFAEAKKWAINRAVELGTPYVAVCS